MVKRPFTKTSVNASQPLWGVSFTTKTRGEFVKICHILAAGLDVTSRPRTMIGIEGMFDVGKSLVADGFLNALDDDAVKYDCPPLYRMSLESQPSDAITAAMRTKIKTGGEWMELSFLRSTQHDTSDFEPQLVVLSGDIMFEHWGVDMIVRLEPLPHETPWHRDWHITITSKTLMTPAMLQQLRHLNNFHQNRQRRLGL
jgi:hypothetical protein